MKDFSAFALRTLRLPIILCAVVSSAATARIFAQAPYALPYTIQSFAGGGKALTLTAPATASCLAPSSTPLTYDDFGDGCASTSPSIVSMGTLAGGGGDNHDIVVDPQGNIYFLDYNSSASITILRRIDARSGVITVAAGSATSKTLCSGTTDSNGDGCQATDGHANASGGYTVLNNRPLGLGVAKNGDVDIAHYSSNLAQRISAATGMMTRLAGVLNGTGKSATGTSGFGGNGGLATSAYLKSPRGIAEDIAGNVYIADSGNNEIQEINASTGIINVIAGSPTAASGSSGDGGPATSALLNTPESIDVDAFGDLYIADFGNEKLRVIYEGGPAAASLISHTNGGITPVVGYIYTVMGGASGTLAAKGTYALASTLTIGIARKLRVDGMGNVYLADNGNNVIDFIDAATGYAHVIAGTYGVTSGGTGCTPSYGSTDSYGDNCPGTAATLHSNSAMSVTVDANENIYITDSDDYLIRKVSTNQTFPTIAAGASATQTLDIHFAPGDGPAARNPYTIQGSADFVVGTPACTTNLDTTQDCLVPVTFHPTKVGLDIASLNVASVGNGGSTLGLEGEGSGAAVSFDPGTISVIGSGLNAPLGAAVDASGNVYVADTGNNRVVEFGIGGGTAVVAGTGTGGYSGDGHAATAARLSSPRAVAITPSGTLYIADAGNNVIRMVNPTTGIITTVAGGASSVCAIARDSAGDGCTGSATVFSAPAGLVADPLGNVYVSDTGHNLIREINPQGYVSLVAGGASTVCSSSTMSIDSFGDNCNPYQAIFNRPTGLAIDANQNIYIADTGNNEIRELVASSNLVVSVAGTGVAGSGNSNGTATTAQVNAPTGVAVDGAGNVYIADTGNSAVRFVPASGDISTNIGTIGTIGSGVGSAATTLLTSPASVAVTGNGNLVVLDGGNNRVILDDRSGVRYSFGRTNIGYTSPLLTILETETGPQAATLTSPLFAASGSSSYFTLTGSGSIGCASGTLSVGESCTLSASFTPATAVLNQTVSASFEEQNTNTVNATAPFVNLSGFAAVLTPASSSVALTNPSSAPQYAVPFSVTTTVTASACNTAAPYCYPQGNVTVYVDGSSVGTSALTTGTGTSATATLTISSPLNVGGHSITAIYQTDGFYAGNTSPAFNVTIVPEQTTSAVSGSPNPVQQFNAITLTAKISSYSGKPTGGFYFYAGPTLIGYAGITPTTGVATLSDTLVAASGTIPAYYYNYGLAAGTYQITVVYSGDPNYAISTSPTYSLTIAPVPQSFVATLIDPSTGNTSNIATTYPGATTALDLFITPSNTLNGIVKLSCTGMPAYTDCGFSPTTLTFSPTALMGSAQYTQVTFWTNVNPAVASSGVSKHLWLFAVSVLSLLVLRKRVRKLKFLLVIPALLSALSITALLTSCGKGRLNQFTTAYGTYNVNVVSTGPNGQVSTLPVTFTVAQAQ